MNKFSIQLYGGFIIYLSFISSKNALNVEAREPQSQNRGLIQTRREFNEVYAW